MEIATQLAQWIIKTKAEEIPKAVLEKAKLHILDTLGVTIAGAEDNVGRVMTRYIHSLGGDPACGLIGTSLRSSPPLAALANGAMGHALDFDDTSRTYLGHPSVSCLPAALAVGELVDASGIQVLGAYIIATEVACKLGATVFAKLYEEGWHTTCVVGAFGGTAAAGKLLGLREDQMVHALAITVSEISGLQGSFGTMSKPFQVGRSAENGVVAALLAQRGMKGFPDIFEKVKGFCHTLKVSNEFGPFYSKMGKPFDIYVPGFYPKEFPCCSIIHPALNATIALSREHRIQPDQVLSVDCAAAPLVLGAQLYENPQDAVQARFSMQFCLAAAILGRGELKVTDFRDERVRDPKTVEMMKKIDLRISRDLEKTGFWASEGSVAAIVEITLKSGKRYRARNFLPKWSPHNMPSWEVLTKKYENCASLVLPQDKLERSIEQIQRLERLRTIRELMASILC